VFKRTKKKKRGGVIDSRLTLGADETQWSLKGDRQGRVLSSAYQISRLIRRQEMAKDNADKTVKDGDIYILSTLSVTALQLQAAARTCNQ